MLVKAYRRYFKNSFFAKVLLAFTVIMLCIVLLLSEVIRINVSKDMRERELRYNELLLYNVSRYFGQKYALAKQVQIDVYTDHFGNQAINNFLDSNPPLMSMNYIELKRAFDRALDGFASLDRDLANVSVYKELDDALYMHSLNPANLSDIYRGNEFAYRDRFSLAKPAGMSVLPAYTPSYFRRGTGRVFSFVTPLYSLQMNRPSGVLMLEFDVDAFNREIATYSQNMHDHQVLIVTTGGDVLFDSSGRDYGKPYPFIAQLLAVTSDDPVATIDGERQIVSRATTVAPDIRIFSLISEKQVTDAIDYAITRMIVYVALACIVTAFVLTLLTTLVFSRRVNMITLAMRRIRTGDLSQRVNVRSHDEIGEIADGLNSMSDSLQEHIERVYAAEIRRKNAELKSLQAQMNPHFLYNALETIRMKSISSGDDEVGRMLYLLANLLRHSIKGRSVLPLMDELGQAKRFLELYEIRFGGKLHAGFDIAPETQSYSILKLLVQPIIENYIVHGFDARRDDNRINIRCALEGDDIVIGVWNNGKPIPPETLQTLRAQLGSVPGEPNGEHDGIGLVNASERIKLTYGESYGLVIDSSAVQGTSVVLRVPAIPAETPDELYIPTADSALHRTDSADRRVDASVARQR